MKLNPNWREDFQVLFIGIFMVCCGIMIGFILGCIFELSNIGTYVQCTTSNICK